MVNLPIEYSDKQVTPFGGMSLLKRFLDKVEVKEYLQSVPLPESGSNRGYDPSAIVQSFWLGIWTGASRYIHCDWLRYDKVLQDIFRMKAMPSQSTYSRFFGKFDKELNAKIFPEIQDWFMKKIDIGNITIDFDSTVITRYGVQEGSKKVTILISVGRNSDHR